jgi:hypothetical protein
MATGGVVDAADQVEHRGFARAVGPNQGEDFTFANSKTHLVDGPNTAKLDTQIMGLQQDVGHGQRSRSDF